MKILTILGARPQFIKAGSVSHEILKYKDIIFFTKTNWTEPPRIRHQLARLLLDNGHNVTFFQKSSIKQFRIKKYTSNNVSLIKHFELFHHQLRPFDFLVKLNKMVAKYFIKQSVKNQNVDLVINFNYDYSFLKDIFPGKKIITIINDDFVAQAKPWMVSSIKKQLQSTCKNSDLLFAVSYPLVDQLKQFNKNTHLLLPWSQNRYKIPRMVEKKNVVLYWGYVDKRVDWDVIFYLLEQKINLRFVGTVSHSVKDKIAKCKEYKGFELFKPSLLGDLPLDDISCSLLAYDISIKALEAVTISNRAFQLLSFGIPLVYSDLPNLIKVKTTVISKCKTNEEYLSSIKLFTADFKSSQSDIKEFVNKNMGGDRYDLFKKLL
jgi:hypothetical protein